MAEILLDKDHKYTVDSIEYPGVTTVLKTAGLMGYLPSNQYYLDRGTFIHDALELYLHDDLDTETLSEGIKGFVESGIRFIEHIGMKKTYTFTELSLHDPVYQYCGTMDVVPLIDYKSGGKSSWHVIQMAAYDNLLRVNKIPSERIPLNVHLRKDGKMPRVEPYKIQELKDGLKVFQAALLTYKWKKEKGLL